MLSEIEWDAKQLWVNPSFILLHRSVGKGARWPVQARSPPATGAKRHAVRPSRYGYTWSLGHFLGLESAAIGERITAVRTQNYAGPPKAHIHLADSLVEMVGKLKIAGEIERL
jgi:hypothetical protein